MSKASSAGVEINTDFPGGNGENIRILGKDHFSLTPRPDPVKGKNQLFGGVTCYFCFSVTNSSSRARKVLIDVLGVTHPGGRRAHLWIRRGETWEKIPEKDLQVENEREQIHISLPLTPNDKMFVSNGFLTSYEEISHWIEKQISTHSELPQSYNKFHRKGQRKFHS